MHRVVILANAVSAIKELFGYTKKQEFALPFVRREPVVNMKRAAVEQTQTAARLSPLTNEHFE